MKSGRVIESIGAVVLLGAVAASAIPPGPPDPPAQPGLSPAPARMEQAMGFRPHMALPRPGLPGRDRLEQAGASDVQIQSMMEFQYEAEMKRIDLQAAIEKAGLALDRLMNAPTMDEEAILNAADTLGQARSAMFKHELSVRLKVKQVLGDEIMGRLCRQGPPDRRDRLAPGPGDEGRSPPSMPEGLQPRDRDGRRSSPMGR